MTLYQKFEVIKKVKESNLVVSLYLKPVDNLPPAGFKPGQHLMFKLYIPGHEIPAFRYYSFSDSYNPEYYRISVKKELPPIVNPDLPPGICSSYMYDLVKEGDILEGRGPSGDFHLSPASNEPVVLIAGGIGITPLLSMIKSIAKVNPGREVYFFYGVNEKSDHSFRSEMNELKQNHPSFHINTFYTTVKFDDVKGLDYDYEGFIQGELILKQTRDINIDHYICGPAGMMNFITGGLKGLGVAENKIHTESFNNEANGPALEAEEYELYTGADNATDKEIAITFAASGTTLKWDDRYQSILEFAEANDIEISSGCLFGDCGTCLTKISEGEVKYMHPTMVKPEPGSCLPCSCIPVSNLVLDV